MDSNATHIQFQVYNQRSSLVTVSSTLLAQAKSEVLKTSLIQSDSGSFATADAMMVGALLGAGTPAPAGDINITLAGGANSPISSARYNETTGRIEITWKDTGWVETNEVENFNVSPIGMGRCGKHTCLFDESMGQDSNLRSGCTNKVSITSSSSQKKCGGHYCAELGWNEKEMHKFAQINTQHLTWTQTRKQTETIIINGTVRLTVERSEARKGKEELKFTSQTATVNACNSRHSCGYDSAAGKQSILVGGCTNSRVVAGSNMCQGHGTTAFHPLMNNHHEVHGLTWTKPTAPSAVDSWEITNAMSNRLSNKVGLGETITGASIVANSNNIQLTFGEAPAEEPETSADPEGPVTPPDEKPIETPAEPVVVPSQEYESGGNGTTTKNYQNIMVGRGEHKYRTYTTDFDVDDLRNPRFDLDLVKIFKGVGGERHSAEFIIVIDNVASVNGEECGVLNIYSSRTSLSAISYIIENIEIKDITKEMKVIIVESSNTAPREYKEIEGKITITLKREDNEWKMSWEKERTVLDEQISKIDMEEDILTVELVNDIEDGTRLIKKDATTGRPIEEPALFEVTPGGAIKSVEDAVPEVGEINLIWESLPTANNNIVSSRSNSIATFSITLKTVDYNTGTTITGSKYSMNVLGVGATAIYDMGTTGTASQGGYLYNGTYTFKQTKVSTGGYAIMPDIGLTVTKDTQGRITNVTSNNADVNVTWNNTSTSAEVIATIKERKPEPTQAISSFAFRLNSVDYSTGAKTTNSKYTMEVPSIPGAVALYNLGTEGTARQDSFNANTTYTFVQTKQSTGGYNVMPEIKLTVARDDKGRITNVTSNNTEVEVNWNNTNTSAEITATIRERKPEPAQRVNAFSIRLNTVDYNTGARTTGSKYSMDVVGVGAEAIYDMGTTGTASQGGYMYNGTYTFKQTKVSTGGYVAMPDIGLSVTRDDKGRITDVTSNNADVNVTWNNTNTAAEVTATIRERKPEARINAFSIKVNTVDYSTGARTTGSKYSMNVLGIGAEAIYDMGTTGTATQGGYMYNGTYTFKQTKVSTGGYAAMPDIGLTVTRNDNGRITNVTSNNADVAVTWNNTDTTAEVTATIRERKSEPRVNTFSIRVNTVDYNTGARTTGSKYSMNVLGVGATAIYDIGTTGTATQGGYMYNGTYTFKQTKVSTGGYAAMPDIGLTVTRNDNGRITDVTSNNADVTVTWNNTDTSVEVVATIREKKPETIATSFSIRVNTVDYTTGAKTTGSKYDAYLPNIGLGTTYNLGTEGSDIKSGYSSNGDYTFKQTQVSSGGYAAMPDIRLTVTKDAQGRITNVTSNSTSVDVTWNNTETTAEVIATIRERKSTTSNPEEDTAVSILTTDSYDGATWTRTWTETRTQRGEVTLREIRAPGGYKAIEGTITLEIIRTGERTGTETVTGTRIAHDEYGSHSNSCYDSTGRLTCTSSHRYNCPYACLGYTYPTMRSSPSRWSSWSYTYEKGAERIDDRVLPEEFRGWDIDQKTGNVTLDIYDIPIYRIELNLIKTDTSAGRNRVAGAEFKITFRQQGSETRDYTVITDGNGMIPTLDYQPSNRRDVTVIVHEQERPEGYKLLTDDIIIYLTFNEREGVWEVRDKELPIDERIDVRDELNDNTRIITIEAQDKSVIEELILTKFDLQTGTGINNVDSMGGLEFAMLLTNIREVQYDRVATNGVKVTPADDGLLVTARTDPQGQIILSHLEIIDVDKPVNVIITENEKTVPLWYKKIEGNIIITLKREGNRLVNTENRTEGRILVPHEFDTSRNVVVGSHRVEIEILNAPIIKAGGNVWLDKEQTDPNNNKVPLPPDGIRQDDEIGVQGIKVMLFTNDVASKRIQTNGSGGNIYGSNGQVLTDMYGNSLTNVRTDASGNYSFRSVENANDYYIVFEYDGVNYDTKRQGQSKAEENANERTAFNNKFVNIAGGSTYINGEDALESSGTATNSGIQLLYQEKEIGAGEYESTLKTMMIDDTLSPARHFPQVLITGDVLAHYKMYASTNIEYTTTWKETWDETAVTLASMQMNMGIRERIFSVSLEGDISHSTVNINGKETIYNYGQIIDEDSILSLDRSERSELAKGMGTRESYADLKYNLQLYMSDYYFRIADYVQKDNVTQVNPIENLSALEKTADDELEVYVTYYILLSNQTMHENVRVDEVIDYYDIDYDYEYKPDSAKYYTYTGESTNGGKIELGTPSIELIGTAQVDPGDGNGIRTYNKMKITGLSQNMGQGGMQLIELTFKMKKHPDIDPIDPNLPSVSNAIKIQEYGNKDAYRNIADISKYSTDQGFVDKYSAAGTAVSDDNTGNFVHDTRHSDQSPGLMVIFNDTDREIEGIVWDDSIPDRQVGVYNHGNGIYEASESAIDDVIVQLIEIVNVGGINYEYIWQEGRTGSPAVRALKLNGQDITEYDVSKLRLREGAVSNQKGEYAFGAYIPGDYIIRYIYGDGRTYDVTKNVRTYNGNDYQSTIDESQYTKKYFEYKYNDERGRLNDGRDNEARRLDTMAETALVNNDIGTKLDAITNFIIYENNEQIVKDGLALTWMCAETGMLDISLEQADQYIVKYGDDRHIDGLKELSFYTHYIRNIDFGVQRRAISLLELEKQLVGLNITIAGVGPILDVRANSPEDIRDGNFESSLGMDSLMILGEVGETNGAIDKFPTSTRDIRGQWYLQTDIQELGRGANLEATYQYIIHNKGEIDYLSKTLVGIYRDGNVSIEDYQAELRKFANIARDVNAGKPISDEDTRYTISKYLGSTYYTGDTDASDVAQVPSRVEVLEEAINNELIFNVSSGGDSGVDFEKVNTGPVPRMVYDTDSNLDEQAINTIVRTKARTESILVGAKTTKEISLTKVLNSTEDEYVYDSYIAEVISFSSATGRRDDGTVGDGSRIGGAIPESDTTNGSEEVIAYVHSNAPEMSLVRTGSEHDSHWAATIRITSPTGETTEIRAENATNTGIIVAIPVLIILATSIVMISKLVLIKKD